MEKIFLFIFFGWLIFLSYLVFKIKNHYNRLISQTRKEKLDEILDLLLDQDKKLLNQIELIKKELNNQVNLSRFYFQKIGLVRFNPFERQEGKQSFVIALLDRENSGIVLNFIYTRDGLRVYTKKVVQGKGEEYQLTDEEKKAIEKSEKKY
jgi:hypothetical protein